MHLSLEPEGMLVAMHKINLIETALLAQLDNTKNESHHCLPHHPHRHSQTNMR